MEARQLRAVWLLGLCQCVLWGALYYSFSVLLVPLAEAMQQPRTTIAAGFSLALLVAAIAAPTIGQQIDRGYVASIFRTGIVLAALGLLLLAQGHALFVWIGWIAVGLASSMALYEPAFALVIRAHADGTHRLRALAIVTVLGGLASTVSTPALGLVADVAGPTVALVACALAVVASGVLLERGVLPHLKAEPTPPLDATVSTHRPAGFVQLAAVFSTATMAGMGLTTLLVPALLERDVPPIVAAWALGALGLAQLPGRIWLSSRTVRPALLNPAALLLQGCGLLLIAPTTMPLWGVVVGVVLFGAGAGMQTVLRPWLIERLVGATAAGQWNGEVARIQGFARAGAPLAAVGLADFLGTPAVLLVAGLLVLACLPSASRLARL